MSETTDMIDEIVQAIETINKAVNLYGFNTEKENQTEAETQDILHFIEFGDYSDSKKIKLYEELRKVRQERRNCKEQNERLNFLHGYLTGKKLDKLLDNNIKGDLNAIKKQVEEKEKVQENRLFAPRIREDLKEEYESEGIWSKFKSIMERKNVKEEAEKCTS